MVFLPFHGRLSRGATVSDFVADRKEDEMQSLSEAVRWFEKGGGVASGVHILETSSIGLPSLQSCAFRYI